MDHHCGFASQETQKRARKRNEQASRFRTDRARAGAGAADRARGRRDRADAAPHPAGGFRPDRERALSGAAAAKPRRRRGAAGNLHADAGGGREGRRLDGVVPRPVLGLRHDGGLSRSRTRRTRSSIRRPASSPGARSPTRCRRFPAAIGPTARWDFASGSRQASWLGAHVQVVEADGTAAQGRERYAGSTHHPVPGDERHHVRRLGRHRPHRHRHRLLFGRQSVHPGEIRRAARRSRGAARTGAALQAHHQHGVRPGLRRGLARRRARHARRGDRAGARQDPGRASRRCARTTPFRG